MTEQMIVPKLRFGDFEGKWEHHSIKDVLTSLVDCEHKTAPYVDAQDYMVVRTNNVKNGSLLMDDMKFTSEDGFREWTKRAVPTYGDILFTREAPAGESCLVPNNTKLCLGQRMVLLRIDQGSKSTIFISHLLLSPKVQNKINSYCIGSTVTRINIADINRIDFDIPSYEEQQKIASFLSKVDEKIGLLSEKKDKLTEYKHGVMQQLFNGKWQEQDGQLTFTPPTLRFKADDGSEFPDWEEKTLGQTVSIKSSKVVPYEGIDLPCIELDNLSSNTGEIIGDVSVNGALSQKNRFKAGDVLFGKLRPYLRKYAHPYFAGICSSEIWVMSVVKELSSNYLFQFVQTEAFTSETSKSSGTKMPRADWKVVSRMALDLPCAEEQTKIANFLSALDQKIDLTNSELNKAKEWKKGLLQQMFV
ncbi:restriction endonuclease subunit S [Vibrio lentus]|uniref:Type I restriction modification DNA specificity domain-containing protein n=1 Tax=Vibrio lentus TaxID=136468 RepID=A0AB36XSC3_9VIBR|nr:restriction endonuclease subunit S [Vibrio lentus]MCC4836756.1 restriction endonuclease subunit S [Vibrio lentus]PMI16418.1 hypothetical protein BCU51_03260 [Vibrio lentus]PMK35422.1 hypothetical protein BCU02_13605 [Vibrio lentus]PMK49958.1 hypothetical protein BCT99_00685 [Vibrio lentus]PML31605.1 hypothetical protein BCT79_04295 [Vibrio lentus]